MQVFDDSRCRAGSRQPGAGTDQVMRESSTTLIRGRRFARGQAAPALSSGEVSSTLPTGSSSAVCAQATISVLPYVQEGSPIAPIDCNQAKPKLLVILGAGSSIPCRMPSVGKIDELMKRWCQEWTPESRFDSGFDVYSVLWKATERYYGSNRYGIRPNFERVLGEMTALARWLSPPPFGNPIIEAIEGGSPVSALQWLYNLSDESAARKLILSQQAFLLEKLADHMRNLSAKFDARPSAISDYVEFFGQLRDRFDLGIYNLNYDTVARNAWPDAYCGFDHHGKFDPSSVAQRHQWGFIYHLHGSVHHSIVDRTHRIEWKDDLGSEFTDHLATAPDMALDFRPAPLTTLIAGGFKLDQLLAEPFQTFYSSLIRHAQDADAFLIAGYGFGDPHVNRALRNGLDRPDADAPPPKAVVLEKTPHEHPQTACRQSHDYWAYQLRHTLNVAFRITREHLEGRLTVRPFIENKDFERDISGRVAVWHGGFREAFPSAGKITDWLSTIG